MGRRHGVDMVALTVQNEPEGQPGIVPWESSTYSTEQLADFTNVLIEELDKANSRANVWLGDSQVDMLMQYAEAYGTPQKRRLEGAGSHWYVQSGPPSLLN